MHLRKIVKLALTDYDKLIDTQGTSPNTPIKTGITLNKGNTLCIYGENVGTDSGSYPFESWTEPENNKCKDVDISSLIQNAQNSELVRSFLNNAGGIMQKKQNVILMTIC